MDRKAHWDHAYQTVATHQTSWFQAEPTLSLRLIREIAPDPAAAIIDVGGGASTLIDHLLEAGYQRLTVLDLSPAALAAARSRLGRRAATVTWLDADVLTTLLPAAGYDLWHDRALFHFLTDPADRHRYVAQVAHAVRPGGHVLVAAFGPDGPDRCSGLPVVRYSSPALHSEFGRGFRLLESVTEVHRTPAGRSQAFVYSLFRIGESASAAVVLKHLPNIRAGLSHLETARLSLSPCLPAHLLTLLEQPERFEQVTGFPAAAGLRDMFTSNEVSPDWLAVLRVSHEHDPWRHGFFLVHRGTRAAIGSAGFKGPPDSTGTVEIAYGVASSFEGQGYATEAAAALVAYAFDTPQVELVRAHTLPTANASTRVLVKCGFGQVGTVVDPEDGPVWRWERTR